MYVLNQFTEGPRACAYLAERQATMSYVVVNELSTEEYEQYMNRGWRKFGPLLFEPVCAACRACRSMRIPVRAFSPTRSQKRTLKRNLDLRVEVATPSVDEQRLELYRRYHEAQAARKGWPRESGETSERDYTFQFLYNPVPALEVSAWDGNRLLAVMLADVTDNVVSAVYHFHDPDETKRGLGAFIILRTIEVATRLGRPWVYLGYYVEGSPSMAYKAGYQPAEMLDEYGEWHAWQPRSGPPAKAPSKP